MNNIGSTVSPSDLRAHRRLGFANYHRDTIDDIDEVQSFSSFFARAWELPLVCYYAVVLTGFVAKEADIDIVAILAIRIRWFLCLF